MNKIIITEKEIDAYIDEYTSCIDQDVDDWKDLIYYEAKIQLLKEFKKKFLFSIEE